MSYYILPKIISSIIVNPKTDTNECPVYISHSLYNFYSNIKEQIIIMCSKELDLINSDYDELIKIVNPYEYIFSKVPGSKYSVSKLKANTIIFYELLEIITTLNILDCFKNKPIKSLHISKDYIDSNSCIDLLRENYTSDIFFNFTQNDKGMIKQFFDQKFDFMFFDIKETNINSYIINLIENVMLIMRFQVIGGNSVIKINNVFHKPIIDLLYILSSFFDKVYIIKPNTSNITTFEKYIVCKNFNNNETKLELYKSNYQKLNILMENLTCNITSILDFDIPYYFMNKIDEMNIIIGQQQLESLDQIINILKNKNRDDKIENIKKSNIQKSVSWCEKFKIPCNKFSEKVNIFLPIIKINADEDEINPLSDADEDEENIIINNNIDINFDMSDENSSKDTDV